MNTKDATRDATRAVTFFATEAATGVAVDEVTRAEVAGRDEIGGATYEATRVVAKEVASEVMR